MPMLMLENVSVPLSETTFARIARLAADRQTTPAEEAARLLDQAAATPAQLPYPLPDLILSEEISAPFDLPLPGPGIPITPVPGKAPLPDLLLDIPEERP